MSLRLRVVHRVVATFTLVKNTIGMTRTHPHTGPIVVAVADPATHSEAVHLAAATGRQVIDTADAAELARHAPKAFAVLIDDTRAPDLSPPHAANVFRVGGELVDSAERVFVLPAEAADLLRAIGALAVQPTAVAARGKVITIVGASGGSGASTLAAALCRVTSRGDSATLLDGHWLSGGLDLLLGIEHVPGARWGEIDFGEGTVARTDVRRALPATADDIAVLTFPRQRVADPFRLEAAALEHVAGAVGGAGLTVVDAPAALIPGRSDLVVVVVVPEVRSVAAATRIVAECAAAGLPCVVVVRDSAWAALTDEEIAHTTGATVLTHLPHVRGLTRTVEKSGLPARVPRSLAACANAVLEEVA